MHHIPSPYFYSVDWGTSRLRVRSIDARSGTVLASTTTPEGIASLAAVEDQAKGARRFADVLLRQIATIRSQHSLNKDSDAAAPIIISGMASSSIGWAPLPYARVPFPLDGSKLVTRDLGPLDKTHTGHVILVSGVRCDDDVLRGEEVEAIGLAEIMRLSEASLALVLPGTHSKHLFIQFGVMTSFRTFLTGELFDLLGRHSVLRHSMSPVHDAGPDSLISSRLADSAFGAGVRHAATEALSAALFRIRTRHLLDGESLEANTDFLSGLLIGSEMLTLHARDDGRQSIVIAASPTLASRYHAAANVLEMRSVRVAEPSEMAMAVTVAHRRIAMSHRLIDATEALPFPAAPQVAVAQGPANAVLST
ncbi:2-dehydro-3-deoxygalactonokinase [soil metagenome]